MEPSLAMRTMGASLEGQNVQGNLSENKERIETEPDPGIQTETNETDKASSCRREYSDGLKNQSKQWDVLLCASIIQGHVGVLPREL